MAVALGLRPNEALLNDQNAHLINFYRHLQRGLEMDIPSGSDGRTYYANRERFNELTSGGKAESKEAAMLFYYLNRNCYNGLCRFNAAGKFNTPHGKYVEPQYVQDLRSYSATLAGFEFKSGDFEVIELNRGDFIYADPPYDRSFSNYGPNGFSWKDHQRLALWLSKHEGPVLISNYPTSRVLRLYRQLGFSTLTVMSPMRIASNGDRTKIPEILAFRNLIRPKRHSRQANTRNT